MQLIRHSFLVAASPSVVFKNLPRIIRTFATQHNPGFVGLVQDLSNMLAPYSGLDVNEIDHLQLVQRMEKYNSSPSEWKQFALADLSRNYTRNLVDRGHGKGNLLLLVWSPGKGSPIHDHANSHCVMKVLQGALHETVYDWPDQSLPHSPLRALQQRSFQNNEVAYMSDNVGLHKIFNPDRNQLAVSLHLYTPPWAEERGCHMFEERTSKSSHVLPGLYSEYGVKIL